MSGRESQGLARCARADRACGAGDQPKQKRCAPPMRFKAGAGLLVTGIALVACSGLSRRSRSPTVTCRRHMPARQPRRRPSARPFARRIRKAPKPATPLSMLRASAVNAARATPPRWSRMTWPSDVNSWQSSITASQGSSQYRSWRRRDDNATQFVTQLDALSTSLQGEIQNVSARRAQRPPPPRVAETADCPTREPVVASGSSSPPRPSGWLSGSCGSC